MRHSAELFFALGLPDRGGEGEQADDATGFGPSSVNREDNTCDGRRRVGIAPTQLCFECGRIGPLQRLASLVDVQHCWRWAEGGEPARVSGMQREVRILDSHEAARDIELAEWAAMSKEERLEVGAELHSFWVRNYFPDAVGLDRTVQIVQRS